MDNNQNYNSFNNIYNSLNNQQTSNNNNPLFTNQNQIFNTTNNMPNINNNNNQTMTQQNNNIQNNPSVGPIINPTIVKTTVVPNNVAFNNSTDIFPNINPTNNTTILPNTNNNQNVLEPNPVNVSQITNVNQNNQVNNSNYNINSQVRAEEIKQKSNNNTQTVYTDGLDSDDDYSKGIKGFLTNKKTILIITILAFIFVCIVVAKAFYFGKKIDHYEEFFTEITSKEDTLAKAYETKEIDSTILKKVAATELISCINQKIDTNNLPTSITSIIDEINNYYNQSYNYFAFKYKDIYTGFTVGYNENQNIFTASTIKAPTDLYIYEMASLGKIDLDEMLTYKGGYYNTGSGVLKNKPTNTKYSVRTLLEYSTVYSDNAAHNMLMDKFGRGNMLSFWKNLGTTAIFTSNNNWGVTNAHDATIYMEELYRFYLEDEKYGEEIMKNFMNATPKFIKGKNNYQVANKSGWSGSAIHDVSIIFADNPYIIVALSNLGDTNYYNSYFNKANDLAYRLHTEYWKYKMSLCNEIKQY